MIIVNCPIMQKKVQELVEAIEDPKLTFVKKDGIKLYFETEATDKDHVCKVVKETLKKDPLAGTIMFTVKPEEYAQ